MSTCINLVVQWRTKPVIEQNTIIDRSQLLFIVTRRSISDAGNSLTHSLTQDKEDKEDKEDEEDERDEEDEDED